MIQANELRIGNYFTYRGTILKVDKYTFQSEWLLSEAKPITLTYKIVSKCGFVKNNEVDHISFDIHLDKYNTLALSKWFYTDRKFRGLHLLHRTVIGKEYSLPPNIDTENMYLHQLQNLYFALTNQELNIQL